MHAIHKFKVAKRLLFVGTEAPQPPAPAEQSPVPDAPVPGAPRVRPGRLMDALVGVAVSLAGVAGAVAVVAGLC